MLGNDVVDLQDVDARPETFRRRFDARVFADVERRAIAEAGAEDALALRWAHWGAKEAAYKLLKQIDSRTVFAPSRFVARFEALAPVESIEWDAEKTPVAEDAAGRRVGSANRGVRRGSLEAVDAAAEAWARIELRSFETSDFVHVVALRAGADFAEVVSGVEARDPATGAERGRASAANEEASLAVRRYALRELARELGVAQARLAIGRRERIPTLVLDGRTLDRALSLSHHGRFVAFALAPRGRLRASEVDGARDKRGVASDRGGASDERMGRGARGTVGCPSESAFLACRAG